LLIVAEGPKKDLEYLIEVSREGPPSAVVEDIEVRWEDYKGEFQEFKIAF
jgi:acylphosphatase